MATEPQPKRVGAIILVRHGEPDLSRKVRFDSAGYRNFWATYELTGLRAGQTPPSQLMKVAAGASHVLSSSRKRALETAQALAPLRTIEGLPEFIEAPLPPPPWPRWVVFSPKIWGFLVRFWWWWFDYHEDQESRAQATVRADAGADKLIQLAEEGGDVVIVAHGFFNAMLGVSLRKRGWRMSLNEGFRYWGMRRYERR